MKPFLAILVLLAACTKSNTHSSSLTIIPIGENRIWTYYDSTFERIIFPRLDTLQITGTTSMNGQTLYLCNERYQPSFGINYYNAILVDSNSIILVNTYNNEQTLLFRKSFLTDTILTLDHYYYNNVYYVPYPLPDSLWEREKFKGKKYHIVYPEEVIIKGHRCYKNRKVAVDKDGNFLSEEIVYVAPGTGIVRYELYTMVRDRWFPQGRILRGACQNLVE